MFSVEMFYIIKTIKIISLKRRFSMKLSFILNPSLKCNILGNHNLKQNILGIFTNMELLNRLVLKK